MGKRVQVSPLFGVQVFPLFPFTLSTLCFNASVLTFHEKTTSDFYSSNMLDHNSDI